MKTGELPTETSIMIFSKKINQVFFQLLLLVPIALFGQSELLQTNNGKVHFKSNAPLEVIQATSQELKGILNIEERTFAFSVDIQSFQGFNSPLQREHFNENYMESHQYPKATFTGKIIEKIDFTKNGKYTIRAKGKLKIHGVEEERIIKSEIDFKDEKFKIRSWFSVLLKEHNLKIPKIVHQKIAEEIEVTIEAELIKK